MKAMTKYQLEHFKDKVKSKFAPMIEEADLSLRKIVADMTESAEKKLSDKIGATEIINLLEDAEAEHVKAMKKARTFFTKNLTAEQKENLDYKFKKDEKIGFDNYNLLFLLFLYHSSYLLNLFLSRVDVDEHAGLNATRRRRLGRLADCTGVDAVPSRKLLVATRAY